VIAYPALLQRDKFEQVLQKLTEVGVGCVVPVVTSRGLVREGPDDSRRARWEAILREAAEQSGRGVVPELGAALTFDAAVAQAVTTGAPPRQQLVTRALEQPAVGDRADHLGEGQRGDHPDLSVPKQCRRQRKLVEQQAVEQARTLVDTHGAQVEQQRKQIEVAAANVRSAHVQLDYCTVHSPFTGVVIAKAAQVGEIVSPFSAGGGFVLRAIAGRDEALFDRFIMISPALPPGAPTIRPGTGGWASVVLPRVITLAMLNRVGIGPLRRAMAGAEPRRAGLPAGLAGLIAGHHSVSADARMLALFPGSRAQEIARHLDAFVMTARELERRQSGLRVVVSAAPQRATGGGDLLRQAAVVAAKHDAAAVRHRHRPAAGRERLGRISRAERRGSP